MNKFSSQKISINFRWKELIYLRINLVTTMHVCNFNQLANLIHIILHNAYTAAFEQSAKRNLSFTHTFKQFTLLALYK